MKIPTISAELIEGLRSRFHPKDRSVYLAANTLVYLNNGAYLSNAFIAETILAANAASATFSNIPQGFRSLILYTSARSTAIATSDNIHLRFNGDSGANYDSQQLFGNAATASASTSRATSLPVIVLTEGANSRANCFSPGIAFIFDYSRTVEKTAIGLSSAIGDLSADAQLLTIMRSLHWRNSNVVTSIVLVPATGPNFTAGSRFQLYGVL